MLVIISAAVITLVATLAARYLLAKTRLTEKSIDAAIARRLHTSPVLSEMRELRGTQWCDAQYLGRSRRKRGTGSAETGRSSFACDPDSIGGNARSAPPGDIW